jgi:hypothetical protein
VTRIIVCIAIALVSVRPALADDAPPTAAQLEAAKKAFAEGTALHDAGNIHDAIEKFKESYRLTKNPLLLYNIGFTMDEASQKDPSLKDLALFYYRKFLSDAPQNAAQRTTVADRVKALEKDKLEADLNAPPTTPTTPPPTTPTIAPTTPTTPTEPPTRRIQIKPPGTYDIADFEHQVVDAAPPGKPLDVTAFVPEDSGWTVTLNYRGAGDASFTTKVMKWHYKELVARIPASKMAGSTIQYFIEVSDPRLVTATDPTGKVTSSGKSASANLITIDASAQPRFFPDVTDEPGTTTSTGTTENPIGPNPNPGGGTVDVPTGNGLFDVGSKKFTYAKWGTTGGAAVLFAGSLIFYIQAGQQADALVSDAKSTHPGCAMLPCTFDKYDRDLQSAGKLDQTLSQVTFGVGLVATAAAGYLWYRQLSHKSHGEAAATSKPAEETSWIVVPSISDGYAGAAAATRF